MIGTTYINPARAQWNAILARPAQSSQETVTKAVTEILASVKQDGDAAVIRYNQQFGGYKGDDLKVSNAEFEAAEQLVPDQLKQAIGQAAANIRLFHEKQQVAVEQIETMPGVTCWRKSVGIASVGLYIPGGSAPLFSTVLMLGIPAQLAGCKQISLCTPASAEGLIHPAILYAAQQCGISDVYKVGGAQAIAAMAYGTQLIKPCFKIFGPGNQYVTKAKELVQQHGTAIDMPAGPSEVLVYADQDMPPTWAAADLLAQAEHGPDSQVILVAESAQYLDKVRAAIKEIASQLGRQAIVSQALNHARFIAFDHQQEAIDFINAYAAEHLIIARGDAEAVLEAITEAGSIFLGYHTPESAGDYASGTNHTLPTYGFAKAYSGVSLDSFVKKITVQSITPSGLVNIGPIVTTMAEAELLDAHALAVKVRLSDAKY